ncbi:hypothetical protein GPECTOR_2g955 [Gonium pectorale]|uniref:PIH1D1/2/3 CS-like domain-containing protein n=1 Tax=Gonium pectorale TaxID=33097 RepID=A0A150H232_GONPE|nr:hypothetical protein GPECTOR_2g955 [Gonium pectorale]|eukprot:KXZ56073.1 hypothetical protein GPECTOR_2g955 [Gonium pectorale]
MAAAAHILYDISDDSSGAPAVSAAATAPASSRAEPPVGGEAAAGLRVPEYTLRELPAEVEPGTGPDRPAGQSGAGGGRLEVCVALPDVASPAEVEAWLDGDAVLRVSAPGKYHLQVGLPCRVLDDAPRAKWSKAKRRLTLTLIKR